MHSEAESNEAEAENIPTKMSLNGIPVEGSGISDCFATFFDEKKSKL